MQETIWADDGQIKIATVADLPWVEHPITGRRSSQSDVEQSNARLIAAAPELLEALQAIIRADTYIHERGVALQQARLAIAKATGQE